MSIPTSRTKEKSEIKINKEKCNGCGLCVTVCKDFSLQMVDGIVALTENPLFGCIGCGHCMAICPRGAIEIFGREISPDDLFDLPAKETAAGYDQLLNLLRLRRSIREFKEKQVEQKLIDKIIDAAITAPMGIPPSDVNILILDTPEKVRKFSKDFCVYLESIQWFVSKWFLALMRPFLSKTNIELFNRFVRPLFQIYIGNMKKGVDIVTYEAPLAIYFYGSPYADPADPLIAATYAMIAGESLGLGTCMLGGIHPMIQNGKKAKEFREKHGIKYASREGLFVIFGYPKVKFRKGIHRTFASVYTPN
jgi:ferredoxin